MSGVKVLMRLSDGKQNYVAIKKAPGAIVKPAGAHVWPQGGSGRKP